MLDPWCTRIVVYSGGARRVLRQSDLLLGTAPSPLQHGGNRGWAISRWLLVFASVLFHAFAVAGGTLVHDFDLPMPEAQIRQAYGVMESNLSNTMDSALSVVVTGGGTVIYYDQWEDGYEIDLAHPVQSATQVWGDGNNLNGIAPGFANDPLGLPAGTVITLRNNVPLPRNPATILYDARDRIAGTKALVISRFAWPTTPGPVMAGAVEVSATMDYGTNYVC